jgi:hypothetical protein
MIRKIFRIKILFVFIPLFIYLLTSCNPDDGPTEFEHTWRGFPYVISDFVYTSTINLFNHGQSIMDLEIFWYDSDGNLLAKDDQQIKAFAIYRFSRPNFIGSVELHGVGSRNAVEAHMEISRNDGTGLALVRPSNGAQSYYWYYLLGIKDRGTGQAQTTIATKNHHKTDSIYVEFNPLLHQFPCENVFEMEIPSQGVYSFKPMDIWNGIYPEGFSNMPLYLGGNTGPNRTGQQIASFTSTLIFEIPGSGMGALNYKEMLTQHGFISEDHKTVFLVDVQDNGSSRTDRIYFKTNKGTNSPHPEQKYLVHFYNYTGSEIVGSPVCICLVHHFGSTGSHIVLSPREVLEQTFAGSVWIEPEEPCNNCYHIEAQVLKESPGNWVDWVNSAPGKGPDKHYTGVIAYVKSPTNPWRYELGFFYPEKLHPGGFDPPINSDTYGNPDTPPPDAEDGVVVLTFRDQNGSDQGWFAFYMAPNETRILDLNQLVNTYLGGAFTGSICYKPMIPNQVEIAHSLNSIHASVNYMRAGY